MIDRREMMLGAAAIGAAAVVGFGVAKADAFQPNIVSVFGMPDHAWLRLVTFEQARHSLRDHGMPDWWFDYHSAAYADQPLPAPLGLWMLRDQRGVETRPDLVVDVSSVHTLLAPRPEGVTAVQVQDWRRLLRSRLRDDGYVESTYAYGPHVVDGWFPHAIPVPREIVAAATKDLRDRLDPLAPLLTLGIDNAAGSPEAPAWSAWTWDMA